MRNLSFFLLIPPLCGALLCSGPQNNVRVDSDKYLRVDRYSLVTEHRLEGPGDLLSNFSKGQRKLRVDYFRKVEEGKITADEINVEIQFFNDDPQIGDKMIVLVNDKPMPMNHVRWRLENKTEPAYRIASCTFFPSEEMQQQLRKTDSMGIRVYLGAEAATATFDLPAVKAVRSLYARN